MYHLLYNLICKFIIYNITITHSYNLYITYRTYIAYIT